MRHIITTTTHRLRAALNVLAGRPTSYRMHYLGGIEFAPGMTGAMIIESRNTLE